MNNTRADMYHNLVCEHRKLSDAHSRLRLELTQKGKLSRHTTTCRIIIFFVTSSYTFCRHALICRLITFYRHFAAATEEQVTALLQRVKELTGMPNPADLLLTHLYFKSFNSCYCSLSSHSFNFKSLQMRKLHWRHATRIVRLQWMWRSSWMTGMPPTKLRWSS
jgi:hypothetical protein